MSDVLIRGGRVLEADAPPRRADVLIRGGVIDSVGEVVDAPEGVPVIDAGGDYVVPGLINAHYHSNENFNPGLYENLPLAQMKDHFDAIEASAYSVSLFTDWQAQRIREVWIKSRSEEGRAFAAPAEFFGAKRASRNLHPIAELGAENCTEQMGVPGPWYERLPHFRMGFTPSAGKELQSEYFVPRKHAVEAILALERLRDQITPHLLISEIRAIAADGLWMSPCYRQDSIAIHFTWKQDWPAVSRLLPVIEKELGPFGVRPHWGKLFTLSPSVLRSRYERLADFVALARRHDPQGKFRNAFLDRNVFGLG